MIKLQRSILLLSASLLAALSACSGADTHGNGEGAGSDSTAEGGLWPGVSGASNKAFAGPSLSDGPDVCFRAIAKQLGRDVKVSEITSFFSAGKEIDSDANEPQGKMVVCKVEYQNPKDPRKLLSRQMDVNSGVFGEPQPVEITVMGGNAATFNIEDYLIPLSKINAAGLISVMDQQKAKLSTVYSNYAWSGVRLTAPGAFSNKHMLRLDLDGRLASNDIKENGYASVSLDGKSISTNYLIP